jgi:hypothetical protein
MARIRLTADLPVHASEAEALWYDVDRWPSFVDGFGRIASASGDWPQAGASVTWDSAPGGRGRVVEIAEQYEARVGQRVSVEDEQIRGAQDIRFEPNSEGVRVTYLLEYELKTGAPFAGVFDWLFVRRPMRDSMHRTLTRFRRELLAERELGAA